MSGDRAEELAREIAQICAIGTYDDQTIAKVAALLRTQVSTTDEAGERTPQDHAIEFGEYLANLAEYYIRQRQLFEAGERDSVAVQGAWNAMRSAIGEFRKRAERAQQARSQLGEREALLTLVKRLDLVHNSDAYRSVFQLSYIHGFPYQGPTYENELNAAKEVLGMPTPPREGEKR